jgi:hypothetical protein
MRASQRSAIRLAESFGLKVHSFEHTGGDHYRLSVENKQGSKAFFVMSNTCSDYRAQRKNESLFRRFADGTFNPVKARGQKR